MDEAAAPSADISPHPRSALRQELAGTVLRERYRIDRLLGQGGMAHVFEGWDMLLERPVAIKRITVSTPNAAGWLQEARCIAALSHPGFVVIHEAWTEDPHGFMVMELVRGVPLSERMTQGPATGEDVHRWLAQASDAMTHAHRIGVIHGDLKPSNLMVQEDGRVRVLDLGLARRLDALRTEQDGHTAVGGTLAYMAPELLMGALPSKASDVYALGLVAQALLDGHHGLADLPPLQLAHARIHQLGPVVVGPGAEPIRQLIAEMLQRDPKQRPSMEIVARRCASVLAPTAAATRRQGKPQRLMWQWALCVVLAGSLSSSVFVDSETADSYVRFGSALFRAEDRLRHFDDPGALDEASRLLEQELTRQPRQAAALALLSLAQCLRYASDQRDGAWLDRAMGNANAALAADDHLALAWTATAWVLEFRRELESAERHYRKALVLEPSNLFALQGLARLLERTQRKEEAKDLLQSSLQIFPGDRALLDALGALLFSQGDQAGAEQTFRRSIAAKPTGVYAYANLAAVLLHEGRLKEALTVLQQGLRLRPHGWLYNNLGNILYAEGRFAEAADAFERGLSAERGNPNDPVNWANLADALRWVPGREQDARAAYKRALQMLNVEKAGEDATTLSRAGLYSARLDEPSWTTFTERALRLAPDQNEVRFRAALAFELSGQRERALHELRAALDKGYPHQLVESEPELIQLRRDRRYHELMSGG